jgi:hypothetical protein
MPCRIHRNVRSVALALALLVLMSGAVQARPLAAHPAPVSYLQTVWQWVLSYAPAWAKAGSEMDPNGYTAKAGGEMDPDGYTLKAGSEMDPDGARRTPLAPPLTPNAGSQLDPNG